MLSLIDRLLCLEGGRRAVSLKAPSYHEGFFADHFAGFPLMPGALMVEGLVESAVWLLRSSQSFPSVDYPLVELGRTNFSAYVRPGQVLEYEVLHQGEEDGVHQFKGLGRIEGKKVMAARFKLGVRPVEGPEDVLARRQARVAEAFHLLGGPAARRQVEVAS